MRLRCWDEAGGISAERGRARAGKEEQGVEVRGLEVQRGQGNTL